MRHSTLLETYLGELAEAAGEGPVLDLACGGGRNGLYLVERGIPVVFADIRPQALQQVAGELAAAGNQNTHLAELWQVDLEDKCGNPLAHRQFSAAIVFRYLHRPLLPALRQAIRPGGMLIYETFTWQQPKYGRPKNPDFLLRAGELQACFSDWEILHSFEGVTVSGQAQDKHAIARLVARKPAAQDASQPPR